MQLGMIGLGRMGANIVRRLMRDGHQCVVFDVDPAATDRLSAEGAVGAASIDEFLDALDSPKAVWIMVPSAFTHSTVADLSARLSPGDIIIDGGNSYWHDDVDRFDELSKVGIHYVDVGTSGGVAGLDRGYCLMIGGESAIVEHLDPIFATLAPGTDAAARTGGRTGEIGRSEKGYLHCGPAGAGHFVKMVHNGIEYGLMAAYAEGLAILRQANAGRADRPVDAETAPLRQPRYYQYDIDIAEVTEVWRRGSVVSSWLLDLTASALHRDPRLDSFGGRVSDSGEGRWTATAAIDLGVPAHVLNAALLERFSSQGAGTFANQVLSAMRWEFGGHAEKIAMDVTATIDGATR